MAPTKSKRSSNANAQSNITNCLSEETQDSQPASQGASQSQEIDTKALEAAVKKQKEQSKARRAERQNEMETSRKQRIDKIKKKLNECRGKHEEKLRDLRRPKVERLRELLQTKRELESKYNECFLQINQASTATIGQFLHAVGGRIVEVSKG